MGPWVDQRGGGDLRLLLLSQFVRVCMTCLCGVRAYCAIVCACQMMTRLAHVSLSSMSAWHLGRLSPRIPVPLVRGLSCVCARPLLSCDCSWPSRFVPIWVWWWGRMGRGGICVFVVGPGLRVCVCACVCMCACALRVCRMFCIVGMCCVCMGDGVCLRGCQVHKQATPQGRSRLLPAQQVRAWGS